MRVVWNVFPVEFPLHFFFFFIELRMHREAGNCYTSAEYGDMDDVTYVRSVLTTQLHTTTDYDRKAKSILLSKFNTYYVCLPNPVMPR